MTDIKNTTTPSLNINISYDNEPDYFEWVHFTAGVSGGSGDYTESWYRSPENDPDNWEFLNTIDTLYLKCTVWPFYLKCEVDDNETIWDGEKIKSYGDMEKISTEIILPK